MRKTSGGGGIVGEEEGPYSGMSVLGYMFWVMWECLVHVHGPVFDLPISIAVGCQPE